MLSAGLVAALVGVAACTRRSSEPDPAPAPSPAVDQDAALRAAAVAREQALVQAYDRALAAAPGAAALLAPLRAEHAQHLAALGAPAPSGGPTPRRGPSGRAADPAARAALAGAERRAAAEHGRDALASSRELAVVLATLGASEASHVVALT